MLMHMKGLLEERENYKVNVLTDEAEAEKDMKRFHVEALKV